MRMIAASHLLRLAMVGEIEIDLAAAEDDAFGVLRRGGIGQDFLEAAGREVADGEVQRRIRATCPSGHENQRLLDLAQCLAAQDVIIAGRSRRIGDLDVVLGAGLEIAFERALECSGPWP